MINQQRVTFRRGPGASNLIKGTAVAFQVDGEGNDKKHGDGPEVRQDLLDGVSLKDDSPDDTQVMGKRQNFTDPLRIDRHAPEGKH